MHLSVLNVKFKLFVYKNRLPFSVIDAGWFQNPPSLPNYCCWGDNMDTPDEMFSDMGRLAEKIRRIGMRPGIWTRPLCGSYKDSSLMTAEELIEMLVRIVARNGNLLLMICPDATGRLPECQVTRLNEMGEWLNLRIVKVICSIYLTRNRFESRH